MNLSFCELDYGAGLAVAEALANKRGLEKIDLNGTLNLLQPHNNIVASDNQGIVLVPMGANC